MPQQIAIVDAFTKRPFSGNPAGVCILNTAMGEERMRAIAAEMNLSETAFLHRENDGYRLRWFTPVTEVKLCGHATLASAHLLWEQHLAKDANIDFYTLSGTLTATKTAQGIELNFPVESVVPAELPPGFSESLVLCPKSSFTLQKHCI